ncbi:MAG: glycerol-3-phosphate dehydrogenase/oxidase [Candidatus Carbobacillus altaicus]|nr:glycerol-3-phosphate dehydrogenase/oxidase [Candidatus Carbobacillus altaicus]
MTVTTLNADQMRDVSQQRLALLSRLQQESFDLVIIGGGITGAGIVFLAALHGYKALLIEKDDLSSGTSSRSTKLIHGGLRYLKQGDVALVREVGRERAVLHAQAPHLVVPEAMLLPLVKGGSLSPWMASVGLWIYDHLAGVNKSERRRMLSKEETLLKEPLLKDNGLIGGGLYVEYRTDDARLTLEVAKAARRYGGQVWTRSRVDSLVYDGQGRVIGVEVYDIESGKSIQVRARQVINAAGPWVDTIRGLDGSLTNRRLHLTKGIHIVISRERFPLRQAVYFDVPDGRMVFAIPRHDIVYIGTTDTDYTGDLDAVYADHEDVAYLLGAVREMFPDVKLTEDDVEMSWAGLRPLIHAEGRGPSELSRRDELFLAPSGLVSIAGGKLTGFRKMAERVLKVVRQAQRPPVERIDSTHVPLGSGAMRTSEDVFAFVKQLSTKAEKVGISARVVEVLVHLFGAATEQFIAELMQMRDLEHFSSADLFPPTEDKDDRAERDAHTTIAEKDKHEGLTLKSARNERAMLQLMHILAKYTIEEEWALHLDDFFIRRTGALYFYPWMMTEAAVDTVSRTFQDAYGWDEEKRLQEIERLRKEKEKGLAFRDVRV